MDTSQLKAFVTVADCQSFSVAAETLHLTQPAVSKRVASLEHNLDSKLLDRIGRNLQLTEAGKALLPRAKTILGELEDAQREIHNLSGTVQGTLRVATSHHIGLHHLPAILSRYTEQYPNVQLQLEFLDSDTAYEAVHRGDVELAIITLTSGTIQGIDTTPLWTDPLEFVVAKHHPLAEHPHPQLRDLVNYPALLPESGTETTRKVEALMHRHKLSLNQTMPTNYLETIKMMVTIGLGWSALPTTIIDDQLQPLTFKEVKLERTLGCISHSGRSLSNAAEAFLQELRA
ncbi:MAG: LysR family transcriptional regulator [Candidatus Pelagadaptatus aseana]|uniref:LysR family transcriptional regulator n=1 Tax=Candidatus Pelagadaptatus aseana TaxID=3120508 RepID=UPI0039B2AC36